MLSHANNALITQTGPGTPLGNLMRAYWIPVCLSSTVKAGAPPERITLLSEKLVVYRTPSGEAGLMDEACPHRGASMALARNEDCGLRCIYHGWKMSPQGDLLDSPTFPEGATLARTRTQVRARSKPVRERHGMIWGYLGEGEPPADLPKLAFSDLPDDHVIVTTSTLNCNWIHPFETLWDIFHAQILHNQTNRGLRENVYFSKNGSKSGDLMYDFCDTQVERTDYGFLAKNIDAAKVTTGKFILPFFQHHAILPSDDADKGCHISVPIDDDHCRVWEVFYNRTGPLKPDGFGRKMLSHLTDLSDFMEGMEVRTPDNRWGQNREAMAEGRSFAGIVGMKGFSSIMAEDAFVIESQGRLDRSREILGPTDRAVVEGRAVVLEAIKAFERGEGAQARDLDLRHVTAEYVTKQMAD